MKFKVLIRNKLNGELITEITEAQSEADAKWEFGGDVNTQVVSVSPFLSDTPKPVKSTYVRTSALRKKVEQMLCDKAMGINKFAPLTETEKAEIKAEFAMLNEECPDLE